MKTNIYLWSCLAYVVLEWDMFPTNVNKIKTQILCSIIFFLKSCSVRDKVEKYRRAGRDTDDNKTHAHSMLDTKG